MQFQSFLGGIYILDRFYITLGWRNCYDRAIYTSIFLGEGGHISKMFRTSGFKFRPEEYAQYLLSIKHGNGKGQSWEVIIYIDPQWPHFDNSQISLSLFFYIRAGKKMNIQYCAIPMRSLFRLFMKLVFIHIHSTLCKSNMAIENHLLMAVLICFNGNIPFFNGWFPPISWMTSSFPRFPEGPGAAAMVLACVLRIKTSSSGNLDLLRRRATVLCFTANDETIF